LFILFLFFLFYPSFVQHTCLLQKAQQTWYIYWHPHSKLQ